MRKSNSKFKTFSTEDVNIIFIVNIKRIYSVLENKYNKIQCTVNKYFAASRSIGRRSEEELIQLFAKQTLVGKKIKDCFEGFVSTEVVSIILCRLILNYSKLGLAQIKYERSTKTWFSRGSTGSCRYEVLLYAKS